MMPGAELKPISAEAVEEEKRVFQSVIAAFRHYGTYSHCRVNKTEAYLNTLPEHHQDMLAQYRDHLNRIRDCIEANYKIIRKMIKAPPSIFGDENGHSHEYNHNGTKIRSQDLESPKVVEPFKSLKVQITLKQFARDWSKDGEEERRQCYTPIIEEIVNYYNPKEMDVSDIKVLVPGAGLGRLAYELACRGYWCEGNEFSIFMLVASHFVLNTCEFANQYTLYPWIHQYVNNVLRSDQLAAITFPDVNPTQEPTKGTFNMVAGDFLEVYVNPDFWDCVATCFFIDCANNVVEFIERIFTILKPGAIWINLGPLLYHYSDVQNEFSIEPTFEDLLNVIRKVGFEILKSETGIRTKYAQNPRSMQQSEYLSVFIICKKPLSLIGESEVA